jgi:hypothetical protein
MSGSGVGVNKGVTSTRKGVTAGKTATWGSMRKEKAAKPVLYGSNVGGSNPPSLTNHGFWVIVRKV